MATETIAQSNATTFTPVDIVTRVLDGGVRVPSFQRGLRWQSEDVRRLFDSIVNGYPIGSLLLWERKAEKGEVGLGALKIKAPGATALFVVDGQQRITSLANALTEEGSKDPRFALAFDLKATKGNRFTKPSDTSEAHIVPLHVLFDLKKVLAWFAKYPEIQDLLPRASEVTETLRQYAIPAYVVKQQDEEVLRDIFDRMNNYGRRLSRAEVFSALHGAQTADGSNIKISGIAEAVAAATLFGQLDEDTVLRAILARRGGDVTRDIRREFAGANRDFGRETSQVAYQEGQRAIELAIAFLQEHAGVPHFSFLPYRYLLVVLTRFFAHFPSPSPRNRTLLRRFFWRAALAGPTKVFYGWTDAMRTLATQIMAGAESESVRRLLQKFPDKKLAPHSFTGFRKNTADTRVLLCALWSLGPMSPLSGARYRVEDLADAIGDQAAATDALQMFFPRARAPSRGWTANRVILLDDTEDDARAAFESAAQFASSTETSILKSHGLSKSMLKLLRAEDPQTFLRERQKRLEEVVRDFVARMAETQFEDTPPLDDLDFDGDDGRDDALV